MLSCADKTLFKTLKTGWDLSVGGTWMTSVLGNCAAILKFSVLDSQGIDRQAIQNDTVNQKTTASS